MKHALVAVDDSGTASSLVATAASLAGKIGAKLKLLRVVPTEPIPSGGYRAAVHAARASLEALEVRVPVELRDGLATEIGSAAKTICECARALHADLIIIGAHRHGAITKALGTTAAWVVDHADRPVLVLRDGASLETTLDLHAPTAASPTRSQANRTVPEPADAEERGALEATSPSAAPMSALAKAGDVLRADHARLEERFTAVLDAYDSGEWEPVRVEWGHLERDLLAHVLREEAEVFPAFRAIAPAETEALAREHRALRRAIDAIGVAVEIRAFSKADVERLLHQVHAHEARENAVLYPFADRPTAAPTPGDPPEIPFSDNTPRTAAPSEPPTAPARAQPAVTALFRHILVPVDFGPSSAAALALAVRLAVLHHARLTLIHVCEPTALDYVDMQLVTMDAIAPLEAAVRQQLAELRDRTAREVPNVSSECHVGCAWELIVARSEGLQADLVVTGTHGRRGLSRVLLGSVAERVVRLAAMPVLTVRGAPLVGDE